MKFSAYTLVASFALIGASTTASLGQTVSLTDVKSATTIAMFVALGGHKASAQEFEQTVVGHPMDEGGWTWTINADGTHHSESKDGSWTDTGGTWRMQGDQYCRESPGNPEGCTDVYLIGNYLRFGLEDGSLSEWTVEIK